MDIRNAITTILPTARSSARSASAAQNAQSVVRNQPSVQARQLVENISNSTSLAAVERQGLIEATSIADQFLSGAAQSQAFSEISSLGVYFEQSTTDEFPRWHVLTGLRAYGLNRSQEEQTLAPPQAQQQIRQRLEQVAANRGTDLADIVAVQTTRPNSAPVQNTAPTSGLTTATSESPEVEAPAPRRIDIEV